MLRDLLPLEIPSVLSEFCNRNSRNPELKSQTEQSLLSVDDFIHNLFNMELDCMMPKNVTQGDLIFKLYGDDEDAMHEDEEISNWQ